MNPIDNHPSHTLPKGTVLQNNYIIQDVLGEGGFGITYSGIECTTNEKVAIKEYFPSGLVTREIHDNSQLVIPFGGKRGSSFEKGRLHFLNEASILREFHHLNSIVSVKDVIEENGTVYLVMEYIDGITLKDYVKDNGPISFAELLPLIKPVIQALIQIHKRGLIHRDISPDNIMVGIDNQFHLIDFGAASFENAHITKTMTVILKSGYAPPEQYLSDGKQGAWTDIYALCATMYLTLTGFAPTESIKRIQQDALPELAAHANISSWQAAAIEKGMNISAADRFQNMESLLQALTIPPIEVDSRRESYLAASIENNKTVMTASANSMPKRRPQSIVIFVVFLFVAFFIIWKLTSSPDSSTPDYVSQEASTTESTTNAVSDSLTHSEKKSTTESDICSMIHVVGFSLQDAREQLHKLDDSIQVNTVWEYDSTQPANTVLQQSVEKNTNFTKGTLDSILLTVSRGPEPASDTSTENDTSTQSTNTAGNKKSGSSQQKTITSDNAQDDDNFEMSPIEDDYDTFTID